MLCSELFKNELFLHSDLIVIRVEYCTTMQLRPAVLRKKLLTHDLGRGEPLPNENDIIIQLFDRAVIKVIIISRLSILKPFDCN
jgi:hypothetical protein